MTFPCIKCKIHKYPLGKLGLLCPLFLLCQLCPLGQLGQLGWLNWLDRLIWRTGLTVDGKSEIITPLTHWLAHWLTDSPNYKEMLSHLKNSRPSMGSTIAIFRSVHTWTRVWIWSWTSWSVKPIPCLMWPLSSKKSAAYQQMEERGFNELWSPHHLLYRHPPPSLGRFDPVRFSQVQVRSLLIMTV